MTFLEQLKTTAFIVEKDVFQLPKGRSRDWLIDVRSFVLNPKNAERIWQEFWEKYEQHFPFQICGESLAGGLIAHLISLKAQENDILINCFLVREERKNTGQQKIIEGKFFADIPVVLFDDIFNSGDTVSHSIAVIQESKEKIHSLCVFVNYETENGKTFLEKQKLHLETFSTLKDFGITQNTNEWEIIPLAIEPEWKFSSPIQGTTYIVPKSNPCIDDEKIYFGSECAYFYALDKKTGKEIWKYKTGEHIQKKNIFSSPVLFENTVFFGAYDGNFYALETKTGKKIWSYEEADWIGSSPCIAEDLQMIFVGLEFGLENKRGGIIALDAKTGEKIWEDVFENYVHSSPAYSKEFNIVVIGSNCGYVRAYDAKTGERFWELFVGSEIKSSFSIDEPRGLVCFGAFDGKEYIVDITSGKIRESIQTEGLIYSSPIIQENTLIFTSSDKNIYTLDLDTFQIKNRFLTSGKILATPTLWENFIVCGSNDGKVYFIDFQQKTFLFFQCTERITNKVIFDESQCYISCIDNSIFCLDLKKTRDIKKEA